MGRLGRTEGAEPPKVISPFVSILRGPGLVFEFVNDVHLRTFGDREVVGRERSEVYAELNQQGFEAAPARALKTGRPVIMTDKQADFDTGPDGAPMSLKMDISYEPMRGADGEVTGLFVQGRVFRPDSPGNQLGQRMLRATPKVLTDRELLTLYLMQVSGAGSETQAAALLDRFGSLGGVLNASMPALASVTPAWRRSTANVPASQAAMHLKLTREIARRAMFERLKQRPLLSSRRLLHTYLKAQLAHEPRERFVVLFLDSGLHLIAEEVLARGTVDEAPVFTREILRRALELSAKSLVLVHNHPARTCRPSARDIAVTRDLMRGADALDIQVIDHLIVAGHRILSMVDTGVMPGRG